MYEPGPAVVDAVRNLHRVVNNAGATMRIVTAENDVTIGQPVVPDGVSGHASTDPRQPVFPPTEAEFESLETDFLESPELDAFKNRLIVQWPEFQSLRQCSIDILWKAKGGASGGKLTFGKCSKMSGLARYYSREDFVIWIAADHVRDHEFTQLQLEALIYHELMHIGVEADEKTGELKWSIVAHDATVFFNEITRYGTWQQDLRILRQSYEQLALASGQ